MLAMKAASGGFKNLSDTDLLVLFKNEKSVEAFTELHRRLRQYVRDCGFRVLYDWSLAEDVCQETFFHIFENSWRFDPSRGAKPWIKSIATNAAIDIKRKRRAKRMQGLPPDLPDKSALQNSETEAANLRDFICEFAAKNLPSEQALVIYLRIHEGKNHKEISQLLEIPSSTVRVRSFLARQSIRLLIKKQLLP